MSILFITRITGDFTLASFSIISLSASSILSAGSMRKRTASTSFNVVSALFTIYSPSLCLGLWIPGVSINTIWKSSFVSILWTLFLVVCGLFDIIAIFSPISLFISVDFPTLGLPISDTKPL